VWEHLVDVNRVLHWLKHVGATVSAKKLFLCKPELVVVGQLLTYEGRVPDRVKVVKIETWPECKTVSDVWGFLGMARTVRLWIKDFAHIAWPLVELTKKDISFQWTPAHQEAMNQLKAAIISCSAICPINYMMDYIIYLSVDSSNCACGYILG